MKIDDLTLVTLVRDRQYNLKRLAEYYKDLNCKKIIFDTSKAQLEDAGIKNCEASGFEYVYRVPMPYPKVYYEASKLVMTEFTVDCPDDDITLIPSIKQSVDFLKENKDYVLCDGEFLWLNRKNGHVFQKYPNKFFGQLKKQFYSTSAVERLKFYFTCNMSRGASVIRTEASKFIWETIYKNSQLRPISFNDRIYGYIATLLGNAKTLPLVYQIRDWSPGGSLQDREDLFSEQQRHILMKDCLDEHHLSPVVDLLIEKEERNISFKEALDLSISLIKNQLESLHDVCCVDTSDWEYRGVRHREQYMSEIFRIYELMMQETNG